MFSYLLLKKISLASGIILPCIFSGGLAQAQSITSDGTLPTPTEVTENGNVTEIIGGTARGNNLFHSFQDFSIPNSNEAFFNNADNISNIFSRVTGGNISNIDGLIRTNNASLFFLNPAGIIFGPGASLNLGSGSFYGSTADRLLFEEGEFIATNTDNTPILTINAPIGLGFRDNPATITNQSGLQVSPGANLALIGGDVDFDRGQATARGGRIQLGGLAAAGTIDINANGSLSFPDNITKADVTLTNSGDIDVRGTNGSIAIDARNITLSGGNFGGSKLRAGIISEDNSPEAQAGDINLNATGAININDSSYLENNVDVNGIGNSGDINIQAGSLNLTNGSLLNVSIFGEGNAGDININVREGVTFAGSGFAVSQLSSGATGSAGNIKITANSLSISDGAELNTSTFGNGDAGNITVDVQDGINLSGFIFTDNGTRTFSSLIRSVVGVGATGNAGNINITGNSLTLSNRAQITTSTLSDGNAGNITLNIGDAINLERSSRISSNVGQQGIGNAGNIDVQAGSLTLKSGSQIGTAVIRAGFDTPGGIGNGGNININATDFVDISGVGLEQLELPDTPGASDNTTGLIPTAGFSSGLISNTESGAMGDAGNITVTTGAFSVADGAIVNGLTSNEGRGGNIVINANTLEATGGGQILTTTNDRGDAGTIKINVSDQINISGSDPNFEARLARANEFGSILGGRNIVGNQGAESGIFANTAAGSTGNGGSITIGNATQPIQDVILSDEGSIAANSDGEGDGGNIEFFISDRLQLRGDSLISARSSTNSDGGNITINADDGFVIAFPSQKGSRGNDIIADAQGGTGGNITIKAQGVLGLEERRATNENGEILNNGTNDIDASGKTDGVVEIITPNVDALRRPTELPTNPVEPDTIVTQACSADKVAQGSNFTVNGRGGVPPQPVEPLNSDLVLTQDNQAQQPQSIKPISTSIGDIYPARGVIVHEDGTFELVAYETDNQQRNVVRQTSCGKSASRSNKQ